MLGAYELPFSSQVIEPWEAMYKSDAENMCPPNTLTLDELARWDVDIVPFREGCVFFQGCLSAQSGGCGR